MAISNRDTILAAFKDEAEEYMTAGARTKYEIGVYEVLRGIHTFDDSPNKPCITIWGYKDEMDEEHFSGHYNRNLFIKVYGYTEGDGYTHDDIHKLARDTEYFLENDFSYKDWVIMGDIIIYEGGISDPIGIFELDVMVKYHTTITSP